MSDATAQAEAGAGTGNADAARQTQYGVGFVVGAATIYSLLHAGFRLLSSRVLGEDDVTDIVLSQDLHAGYDSFPRQPPLYDWVLWAVQQLTGPRFENFLVIKYGALIAAAVFLYLAARRALGDRLFALLTVESLALIYSISWRYHEGFTHEVGAMVAVLATAWLVLRIAQDRRTPDFAWLGLVMGLGVLTEPAYTVFLVALLIAVAVQPGLRMAFFGQAFALSVLGALAIASPYLLWMFEEPRRLYWLTRLWHDGWSFNWDGFWDAVRGPVAYLSPLAFILPVIFPGWLKTAWGDLKDWRISGAGSGGAGDYERLILHATGLAFAASVIGAVVFEVSGLAVHVLMPLYLISVIWLFGVARRSEHRPVHVQRFGRLALVIALIAFTARMANLYIMDPVCNTCRWGIPYDAFAKEMRARGVDDRTTIVSLDNELSGNLRPLYPASPVITRLYPNFTPEGADWTRGRVAYVWEGGLDPEMAQKHLRFLLPKGIEAGDGERIEVPWRSWWRDTGYRTSAWHLLVVEKGLKKRVVNTGRENRLGL